MLTGSAPILRRVNCTWYRTGIRYVLLITIQFSYQLSNVSNPMFNKFNSDHRTPNEQLVLAVDLGTSGCKCALVAIDGTVIAWSFHAVKLHVNGVSAEQDPLDWWAAFQLSAGRLLANDAGLRGRGINIEGYAPLTLWRWLRLTGGAPSLSGRDSAGHIAYICDQEPERQELTYKFLNVLDYMNLRLTGRFCATRDSMLTAWITDNRDPHKMHYDQSLIKMMGFDAEKLPELVQSTDVIGTLLPEVADVLGLAPTTVVVAGAVDNSAVAVGAAVDDFETHLYLGTSSWLGAHVPFMKTAVRRKIAAVPCAVNGRYLAMALQSTAGANLSFLRDRILYHPDELLSDEQRPDVYDVLNQIAARVPAGARGLIYTPWLFGERTPVDDPSLRAGLINLSLEHSREDIFRAFLEGVAQNTRWMLEPFAKLLGRDPGTITAVGGGAQSDLWCQIMADVTGQPIRQLASPIQANAIGAAYIAGVGIGAIEFSDLKSLRKTRHIYEPASALRRLYNDQFESFKEVRERLAPLYRRLNQVKEIS